MPKKKSEGLTPRQWWLFRFMEEAAKADPTRWVSDDEIIDACQCDLSYVGERYERRKADNTHDHCASLRADIEDINASLRVNKHILYVNYKAKFAGGLTKESATEEAMEVLNDLKTRALRMLKRYGTAIRKIRSHGQGKLLNMEGNPLNEWNEQFVESLAIREALEEISNGLDNVGQPL